MTEGAGLTTTAQERMDRLQRLLSGTSESRTARNLARGEKTNVLWGVALHAADRLRQGEALTDLEEKLVSVLRAVLPEEEIGEWGRAYRETVAANGTCVGVPQTVAARPASKGYCLADWAGDQPAVAEEWARQPNTAVLDRQGWAAGGEFDSPELIEALPEWGFGVTAASPLTGPASPKEGARDDQQELQEFHAGILFESFYVHRTVGDGWPGTRDEIRWTSAGSTDRTRARPFLSQEFGGNATGEGNRIPFPGNRTVFRGAGNSGLVLNVMCWEWDTGDGDLDSIGEVLTKVNDNILFSLLWDVVIELTMSEILGLLADITMFSLTLINLIVKNDLSCARTIFLTPWDLALLARRGGADWHFNGDGHHSLRVRTEGPIPFPKGTLEYVFSEVGPGWATPVPLPWVSMTAPALASYDKALYALFVRPEDHAVMWTRLKDGRWSEPERVNAWTSLLSPSLTVFNDRLHCVFPHPGTDRLHWATFDGTTWSPTQEIPDCPATHRTPALAATTDRLYLEVVDASHGSSHTFTSTGTSWTRRHTDIFDTTPSAVSLTWDPGYRIFKAKRGDDNSVKVYTTPADGTIAWLPDDVPPGWRITCGPTITGHLLQTWLFLRAEDGTLRGSVRHRNRPWVATFYPNAAGADDPIRPMDEVDAFSHAGTLYVMYRR
ncbi:hypothetical protein ABZ851_31410 [Streptomyces sp. NPDC047049]|uniref:hypothetical protein n=1 Tax=Streptomyces sp. NPDC047049 TaxID=3156688 RepID=UPI0033DB6F58